MIARFLKILLALQCLAVVALFFIGLRVWHIRQPGVALTLALGSVILFRLSITAHNFWQSWRCGSTTPSRHRLRLPDRCRLFFGEFVATLATSSWAMAWPKVGMRVAPDPVGLPLLLIHGYLCNSGYWTKLSSLLMSAHISHYALDLEPLGADIDDDVPLVHDALKELCAKTGSAQVIIVAHSMGGLVARAYLRRHGNAHIARVITLGTPHHGTGLASFGYGCNARQMRRSGPSADATASDWLNALAAMETRPQRALFTSIFSHHDNIIAPQTSSYLPGAKNIEFGAIGHVALGRTPRILQCVLDEIALASKFAAATRAESNRRRV